MSKPCDICLEEKCEGRHDCHCDTCSLKSECYRQLHPTIRITNKCTQKCGHCCFSSHPDSKIMMTIEQSEKTAKFLKNNEIKTVNLMGGEFFCNPDWFEILSNIVSSVKFARIVTNGDWANSLAVKSKLSTFISLFGKKIQFSISKDCWHTNKNVEAAAEFFKTAEVPYNVANSDQTTKQSIVPVGRARGQYISGLYDMMGCYCQNPENMYSFLIDEEGDIYKCGFGMLKYANIEKYLDGGFNKRFKEYNSVFYTKFIPSCGACSNFVELHNGGEYGKIMVKNE